MAPSPLLTAAVALLVLAFGSAGAYAAAEQEAAGAGGNDMRLRQPPVARGLSFDFYKRSCPKAESIVRKFVHDAVRKRKDFGLAAGLLRLHFHDCFVQGCDASVLLDGSATEPGEKQALPNLTLRPSAFKAINDIRDQLERKCHGAVVSCSDILALAACDSVVATGGPEYRVPLGRRDSARFATRREVLDGLPRPSSNVRFLLEVFHNLSLDAPDLVALSGGHTIGDGHCTSFEKRLYPLPDHNMSPSLLARLKRTCPAEGTNAHTTLDEGTPDRFNNNYFLNLVKRTTRISHVPDGPDYADGGRRHR